MFNHADYGPCPGCMLWVTLKSTLVKHQKVCPAAKGKPERSAKGALGPVSQSSSQAQVRRVSAELETCLNGDGDDDGFLGGA